MKNGERLHSPRENSTRENDEVVEEDHDDVDEIDKNEKPEKKKKTKVIFSRRRLRRLFFFR